MPPSEVPGRIAIFAFLFCRELFWEKRHEPTHVLWQNILERFNEWELDPARQKMLEEQQQKVIRIRNIQIDFLFQINGYAGAIQKIVALERFFDSVVKKGTVKEPKL